MLFGAPGRDKPLRGLPPWLRCAIIMAYPVAAINVLIRIPQSAGVTRSHFLVITRKIFNYFDVGCVKQINLTIFAIMYRIFRK